MQSAYRERHGTETALSQVHNDIMLAIDSGCGVFLVLLDLSVAFDTVDHNILLDYLKHYVGIDGTAFNLLQSHLL